MHKLSRRRYPSPAGYDDHSLDVCAHTPPNPPERLSLDCKGTLGWMEINDALINIVVYLVINTYQLLSPGAPDGTS